MTKELTTRSLAFVLVAAAWMLIAYAVLFGGFSRVRADEEGKTCPRPEGNCYWTNCHANYDGNGNILSETCNGHKFQPGGPSCSEADCVKSGGLLD